MKLSRKLIEKLRNMKKSDLQNFELIATVNLHLQPAINSTKQITMR